MVPCCCSSGLGFRGESDFCWERLHILCRVCVFFLGGGLVTAETLWFKMIFLHRVQGLGVPASKFSMMRRSGP